MSYIYFETNQFVVREWELSDIDDLYKIMSDSKMHVYTGDTVWTRERSKAYMELMINHNLRTLGMFHGACILKNENELIGFTGLNPYLPKQPELEWHIGVKYWNNGYATEIGKAIIYNAFKTTDIESIFGMANPKNNASMKALAKVGMKCLGLQDFRGHQDMLYRIDR